MLGGTAFVGHAVVLDALARGVEVTTFNRGHAPDDLPAEVRRLHGDRLDPASLGVLGEERWDVAIDTWSDAPAAVAATASRLAGRVARYVYVSSGSVYPPPLQVGVDEGAVTVEASPEETDGSDYAVAKRGGELAAERAFGDRAFSARCGLILGPREDVGRLPWWLKRMARGGEVLAPGPGERPLSLVDVRDLAAFLLDAADAGLGGPCNVVSRRGHATMAELLEACLRVAGPAGAHLAWTDPESITACEIEPRTELPVWLPPGTEFEGLHGMGVERAHAAGLRCRPVAETVADTWAWMQSLDGPRPAAGAAIGLSPEREATVLAARSA